MLGERDGCVGQHYREKRVEMSDVSEWTLDGE